MVNEEIFESPVLEGQNESVVIEVSGSGRHKSAQKEEMHCVFPADTRTLISDDVKDLIDELLFKVDNVLNSLMVNNSYPLSLYLSPKIHNNILLPLGCAKKCTVECMSVQSPIHELDVKSGGTSVTPCYINQQDDMIRERRMEWPMNHQAIRGMYSSCISDNASDMITLGIQCQNKKFMLTLSNILKGKGSQDDLLYGIIVKMKEKLAVMEMESQQCKVPKNKLLKIQEVAQNLGKSEGKLDELKVKYKKVVTENKDLKKERQSFSEEKRALRKEIKEIKDLMALKEKSIIGLHEKLELARVNEIRLLAKVELLESITASKQVGMNIVENEAMDRCAEKISKIQELEKQVSVKESQIADNNRKIEKLNQDLTITNDLLAEKDKHINNIDRMYAETIETKNKVIEQLTRVTNTEDELALGFKRILIKTLAEKELRNVKELYMDMKCTNASTQTTQERELKTAPTINNLHEPDHNVLHSSGDVHVEEIAMRENQNIPPLCALDSEIPLENVSPLDNHNHRIPLVHGNNIENKHEMVTVRVLNLPPDMEVSAIESFFDINKINGKKVCHVVICKITKYRVLVKIVVPRNMVDGLLKFDNAMLHKRKLRIFLVEKCRLGAECMRKICRFGHEEVYSAPCKTVTPSLAAKKIDAKDVASNTNSSGTPTKAVENDKLSVSKKETLWMIKNLPEKINTLGVLRFIRNLGIVVHEKRNEYQVLSIKTYAEINDDKKVEAILQMPEEMGRRLLTQNGAVIGNCCVEVLRTKECRFGEKCLNLNKNCSFYHKKNVDRSGDVPGKNVQLCWFQTSCPFGDKCKFAHPEEEINKADGKMGKNC